MQVTLDHNETLPWVMLTRCIGTSGIEELANYFELNKGRFRVAALLNSSAAADRWEKAYEKLAFGLAAIVGRESLRNDPDTVIPELLAEIKAMIGKEVTQ